MRQSIENFLYKFFTALPIAYSSYFERKKKINRKFGPIFLSKK